MVYEIATDFLVLYPSEKTQIIFTHGILAIRKMKSKTKQTNESIHAVKVNSKGTKTVERRGSKAKRYRLPNEIILGLILTIALAGTMVILSQIGFLTTQPATPAAIPNPGYIGYR